MPQRLTGRVTPGSGEATTMLESFSLTERTRDFPSGDTAKPSTPRSRSKPASGRRDGVVSRPGSKSCA